MNKEPEDVFEEEENFEDPSLLGAEDLEDAAGGCAFSCSNGDCSDGSITPYEL